MGKAHYKISGPLFSTPPDSEAYVEREADKVALRLVSQMEYITLIEPRQQGKTSLIYHLKGQLSPHGYTFVYFDLTTANKGSTEASWYRSICMRLLNMLRTNASMLVLEKECEIAFNGDTWFDFLSNLAKKAMDLNTELVVVFDEVGAAPARWSSDFFSTIRSVYIQRESLMHFRHLTLIVSGAFNPRLLIRDAHVSNFNISQRVGLADFTLDQVTQFTARLNNSDRKSRSIARRIHELTGGHPYMTQYMCYHLSRMESSLSSKDLDNIVEEFRRDDQNNLPYIMESLKDMPKDRKQYLTHILKNEGQSVFSPAEHPIQAELSLIGLIKSDRTGRCIIRNQLYRDALNRSTLLSELAYKDKLRKLHSTPRTGARARAALDNKEGKTMSQQTDKRKVFVVHGRNGKARDALFAFLRALGLLPLEWSQAIDATGKASPYVGEVLDAALDTAQAIVVLLTPDDEARLREPFRQPHDPSYEIELTPQARPNVLFEAGMALGRSPNRTVIVELGETRPFSDVVGRHVIRMVDSPERRQELAQRLMLAGCEVDRNGTDWYSAGDFKNALL